jgi:coenzyme PQQ precursor peptide PqqA
MQWTKPDFQEITLNMEVTAYVNTEGAVAPIAMRRPSSEKTPGQSDPRETPDK